MLFVGADWCGPCKTYKKEHDSGMSTYESWTHSFPEARFSYMDLDSNPITREKFDLNAVPAFLLFKNGKLVNQDSAMDSINKLPKLLK